MSGFAIDLGSMSVWLENLTEEGCMQSYVGT